MQKIKHFIRDHLGPVLAGTVACVVLVGGILLVTLAGSGGAGPAAAGSSTTTTAPAPPAASGRATKGKAKHPAVHGAVTAIAADAWSVTVKGASLTVDVTPGTKFGTRAAPLSATDFAVGNEVTIAGARTGDTVTATRIARTPAAGTAGGPTTTAPTTVPATPAA